jgi:hypothetical protein
LGRAPRERHRGGFVAEVVVVLPLGAPLSPTGEDVAGAAVPGGEVVVRAVVVVVTGSGGTVVVTGRVGKSVVTGSVGVVVVTGRVGTVAVTVNVVPGARGAAPFGPPAEDAFCVTRPTRARRAAAEDTIATAGTFTGFSMSASLSRRASWALPWGPALSVCSSRS